MEIAGLLFVIFWLIFCLVLAVAWVHGIILTFRASVILGLICLLLHVPFVLVALVYWVSGFNLAQRLVDELKR